MSDLERKARADPSPETAAQALRDAMRRGQIEPERVRAAAACGHPAALALFPNEAEAERPQLFSILDLLDRPARWTVVHACVRRAITVLESELPDQLARAADAALGFIRGHISDAQAAAAERQLKEVSLAELDPESRYHEAKSLALALALNLIDAARTAHDRRLVGLLIMAEDAAAALVPSRGLHPAEYDHACEETRDRERAWQLRRLGAALLEEAGPATP